MVFDQERFWRALIVLAIVLAGFALGFALVKQQPVVVQGGFSQQTVTMVEYRVTDGSSRISYGGDSYTVTDGLVSLPYTATWAADMVAAGILERVGAPSANLYYGGNALRVATSGTVEFQSGSVVSISAPIRTALVASGTLTVVGAAALNGGLAMDTNKFTVADGSGNTSIAGALNVDGNVSSSVGAFTVTDALAVTGATSFLRPVLLKTASYTLTVGDSGAYLANYGAGAGITITLPGAAAGYHYCVGIGTAKPVTITPAASDIILGLADAADDRVRNAGTVGDAVCLVALDGVRWIPDGQARGTWSDIDH